MNEMHSHEPRWLRLGSYLRMCFWIRGSKIDLTDTVEVLDYEACSLNSLALIFRVLSHVLYCIKMEMMGETPGVGFLLKSPWKTAIKVSE